MCIEELQIYLPLEYFLLFLRMNLLVIYQRPKNIKHLSSENEKATTTQCDQI